MDLQILLGDGAWSGKNTGRDAGVEELASGAATVGSELDEPVGGLDQVGVVLDEDDGIAGRDH